MTGEKMKKYKKKSDGQRWQGLSRKRDDDAYIQFIGMVYRETSYS